MPSALPPGRSGPTAHVLRNASIHTRNAIDRVHGAEDGGGVTPHDGGDDAARDQEQEDGGDEAVRPGAEGPWLEPHDAVSEAGERGGDLHGGRR